jgi:hypothetical protein
MPIRERSGEGGFYSMPKLNSIALEETLIGRTLFDMRTLIGYSFSKFKLRISLQSQKISWRSLF